MDPPGVRGVITPSGKARRVSDRSQTGLRRVSDGSQTGLRRVSDGSQTGLRRVSDGSQTGLRRGDDGVMTGWWRGDDGVMTGWWRGDALCDIIGKIGRIFPLNFDQKLISGFGWLQSYSCRNTHRKCGWLSGMRDRHIFYILVNNYCYKWLLRLHSTILSSHCASFWEYSCKSLLREDLLAIGTVWKLAIGTLSIGVSRGHAYLSTMILKLFLRTNYDSKSSF